MEEVWEGKRARMRDVVEGLEEAGLRGMRRDRALGRRRKAGHESSVGSPQRSKMRVI